MGDSFKGKYQRPAPLQTVYIWPTLSHMEALGFTNLSLCSYYVNDTPHLPLELRVL